MLAAAYTEAWASGAAGSPAYMAPEVIEKSKYSLKADMWYDS